MTLVDHAPLPDGPEGPVYEGALAFLDKVLEEADSRGLSLRDRLDAQGLLWCVHSQDKKPDDWTDQDWKAYQKYRGGAGNGPPPPPSAIDAA